MLYDARDRLAARRKQMSGKPPSYGWQFTIRGYAGGRLTFTRHCAQGVDQRAEQSDLARMLQRGELQAYEIERHVAPLGVHRVDA